MNNKMLLLSSRIHHASSCRAFAIVCCCSVSSACSACLSFHCSDSRCDVESHRAKKVDPSSPSLALRLARDDRLPMHGELRVGVLGVRRGFTGLLELAT